MLLLQCCSAAVAIAIAVAVCLSIFSHNSTMSEAHNGVNHKSTHLQMLCAVKRFTYRFRKLPIIRQKRDIFIDVYQPKKKQTNNKKYIRVTLNNELYCAELCFGGFQVAPPSATNTRYGKWFQLKLTQPSIMNVILVRFCW